MGYRSMVAPPKQDEANAVIKTLYVCQCKGCGIVHDRNARFCADHAIVSSRAETEKEYNERKII